MAGGYELADEPDFADQIAKRDPHLLDRLLAKYLPELRAFIRLRAGPIVRERESSSDLAQSVCRELLEHADRFEHQTEAGFKQWMYRTALRKICDRYDYYGAGKRAANQVSLQPDRDSAQDLLACYGTFYTPSKQAEAREELSRVESAFDQLSEEYREVIVLSRIVGLSHADVAQQMGRSEGAVRNLLYRALAALAKILN
jgi:RNA polymerase sigma-70 factor (ECF subfamily)